MDLQRRVSGWIDRHQKAVAFVFFLAVGVSTSIAVEQLPVTGSERPTDWFSHVLIWASAVPLFWYRTKPTLALIVSTGFVLVQWVLDYPFDSGAVLWVLFYAATRHGGDDRAQVWRSTGGALAAVMLVAIVGVFVSVEDLPALALIAIPLLFGTFAMIGEALYQRSRYVEQLEQRNLALVADIENKAELAAIEERTRIAREMHDIIAHGMSTVVVQAQAGQRVVDEDPTQARAVFATIENIGRSSVDEMRRMLGVLRRVDSDTELEPQPGLANLDELRSQVEVAGVELTLSVIGECEQLPPGLDLSAYRIVQEALTNVLRHAGRPVMVNAVIECGPNDLMIQVDDDGLGAAALSATAGTGHGLRGMAERVEIYNGTLTAGPAPGGGFSVRAVLPLPARVNA